MYYENIPSKAFEFGVITGKLKFFEYMRHNIADIIDEKGEEVTLEEYLLSLDVKLDMEFDYLIREVDRIPFSLIEDNEKIGLSKDELYTLKEFANPNLRETQKRKGFTVIKGGKD